MARYFGRFSGLASLRTQARSGYRVSWATNDGGRPTEPRPSRGSVGRPQSTDVVLVRELGGSGNQAPTDKPWSVPIAYCRTHLRW